MLRPELKSLAEAGALCMIEGRVLEMKRTADGIHVDVLLKRCDVRRAELGRRCDLHPVIRTDHLWVRMPVSAIAGRPGSRYQLARQPITLLQEVCTAGQVGFYVSGADRQLGIGLVKPATLTSENRLQHLVDVCLDDFKAHRADPEAFKSLADCVAWVSGLLDGSAGTLVIARSDGAEIVAELGRMLEHFRRSHQAELKAAQGARLARYRLQPATPACLLQVQPTLAVPAGGTALDALLARGQFEKLRQVSQDLHKVKPCR